MKRKAAKGHVVARIDEIPSGGRKIVSVAGREIGIFNVNGEFFALRNICPHRGAPVCLGRLRPHVEGSLGGDFVFQREGEVLKCPWHEWEFDIKTGLALHSPGMRVRTFQVERRGLELVVYL